MGGTASSLHMCMLYGNTIESKNALQRQHGQACSKVLSWVSEAFVSWILLTCHLSGYVLNFQRLRCHFHSKQHVAELARTGAALGMTPLMYAAVLLQHKLSCLSFHRFSI